ncbi:MAG: GAF domain-containing protein [Anaerolineae bacterium]|nr:GAF domain-containing protein [Anaerolineae bacterium]
MRDQEKTKNQLIEEIQRLRQRVAQTTYEAAQQHQTFTEVMVALTSKLSLPDVLDEILLQAHRIVPYHTASIMLLEKDTLRIARWKGYDIFGSEEMVSRLEQPLAEFPMDNEAIQSGEPIVIFDTHEDDRWVVLKETTWIRSTLMLPLRLRDHVPGVLRLDGSKPGEFTIKDAYQLKPLAGAAAIALENARLFGAEQLARKQAENLRRANLALTKTLDSDTILETMLDHLARLVPYDQASITLLGSSESLYVTRHESTVEKVLKPAIRIDKNPLIRKIIKHQKTILISDTRTDSRCKKNHLTGHSGSWLGGSFLAGERVIGVYTLQKAQPTFFNEDHQRLVEVLAAQAATALVNAQLYEQVTAGRERLQILSGQLVEIQEAERRFIARELHDEIGQALTGLKLLLEMASSLPRSAQGSDNSLLKAQHLVENVMEQVDSLSLDLRPPMLDDLGLLPALLWYCQTYTERTGIQVLLKHRMVKNRRFPAEIETAAYRIIQEALTNVARHTKVSEVTTRVTALNRTLNVQIIDQGTGFNITETLNRQHRRGLTGMRERAKLLQGQLKIESRRGVGTQITAELPLPSLSMERNI